jgi:hypothetical protein
MNSVERLFDEAGPHGHLLQFYQADEPLLNRNVGRFLWEGLLRGDGLLVIASAERRESVSGHLRRLGVDIALAVRESQLLLLDARATLDRFLIDGRPDRDLFRQIIGDALKAARPRTGNASIRAYGEMVGLLWQAEEHAAAVLLEEHWNEMLHNDRFTLFCGYPIDIFAKGFDRSRIEALLCAHTHCIPAGSDGNLDRAVHQAMEDVLGQNAPAVRLKMTAAAAELGARPSPAEGSILWLRRNLPAEADGILSRARSYYEASQVGAESQMGAD